MAARIKEALDVEPELVKGDNGIFDVEADGVVVFSKHQAGRFPEPDEVVGLLR